MTDSYDVTWTAGDPWLFKWLFVAILIWLIVSLIFALVIKAVTDIRARHRGEN